MNINDYVIALKSADDRKELVDLGVDENVHIGFQDQTKNLIQLLDRLGAEPWENNPRCFHYGESEIVLDIRDAGYFMMEDSVKNSGYYNSVLWMFLGSLRGDGVTEQNFQDMKTVLLESIQFGLDHTAPFLLNLSSSSKYGSLIPSSDYLLHS